MENLWNSRGPQTWAMFSLGPERSTHRWRPLCDSRIANCRGEAAIRWSAWFGLLRLPANSDASKSQAQRQNGDCQSLIDLYHRVRSKSHAPVGGILDLLALRSEDVGPTFWIQRNVNDPPKPPGMPFNRKPDEVVTIWRGVRCLDNQRHQEYRQSGEPRHVMGPNAKVSDGSQLPAAAATPLGVTDGYRSLDRLVRCSVSISV